LPNNANPDGPTKTASIFDVTKPIQIFIKTLMLFNDVILNKLDCNIDFILDNLLN
jgi:hypothetical protein